MTDATDPGRSAPHGDDSQQWNPLAGGMAGAVIMMVDDEPLNMEVIQTFLEDVGYRNFVTTSDSTEALEVLRRERPDVLLLDLVMPEVSGFDILHELRTDEATRYIPVLVLTSATDGEMKLKALELGATDFLAKPVDPSELALRLRNTLAAKAYQDRLLFCDALTGLPNRRQLAERLDLVIARAARDGRTAAVLHVDLDRFKALNDTLGHRAGDALLQAVAARLLEARAHDGAGREHPPRVLLSRFSADEFTILLSDLDGADAPARLGQTIVDALSAPFRIDGRELYLSASVGSACYPGDGDGPGPLLQHAAIATSAAKEQGGNRYEPYSPAINRRTLERLNFETELRGALDRGELVLHYQPKVDVASGRIVGAEALVRWSHPRRGLVPPGLFIPIAEETGLIVPIGEWILTEACRECRAWHRVGLGPLKVAINLSSKQFTEPGLVDAAYHALDASGLDPGNVVLELTETVLMDDARRSMETLRALKAMGLRLSVDDFGTGYSSFSYLKQFPLDELKVDRSFVTDLEHKREDVAIVSAIVAVGHALDLTVVAEGVESAGQLEVLRGLSCNEYQGYWFSKPVPSAEFGKLSVQTRAVA